jgi:hypothetical protein
MNEKLCNLFESCESAEAPLCPLQEKTVKSGIWYPDEPICQACQFQQLPWVKKQHLIAGMKLKSNAGFFTVNMLNALHSINSSLRGADPDYANPEEKWFSEQEGITAQAKIPKHQKEHSNAGQKPINMPLFQPADFLQAEQKLIRKNIRDKRLSVKLIKRQDGKKEKPTTKKNKKQTKRNK